VAEAGFWGYRRADGRVGVRNHVLVLPGGFIAAQVCWLVPGVATLRTADKGYGRTARDRETIFRVLAGLGRNPNVYGVLLVTGTFLIVAFATWLHVLPATSAIGSDQSIGQNIAALVLPVITLSLVLLAYIGRMTRTNVIDVMETDYIRSAILKGLPYRRVVIRHALRNALLPSITIIASNVGWLLGGIVVTESLFGYPGLGRLLLFAVQSRDVMVIQDVTLLIALIYAFSNLAADILYAVLNPRVRYA
jgi:ABC-type antimicrobial peptide transport system permease subunit